MLHVQYEHFFEKKSDQGGIERKEYKKKAVEEVELEEIRPRWD